jgi:type IV pilus assembly protein PilQ
MMKAIAMLLAIGLLLFMGCSPKATVKKSDQGISDTPEQKLITGIMTEDHMDAVVVLVQGNRALTFTSVKQPFPPGVILYFPETSLDQVAPLTEPGVGIVQAIKASELDADGNTARIEISLENDFPYDVVKEDSNLRITFKKPSQPVVVEPAAAEPSATETVQEASEGSNQLRSVYTNKFENGVSITVKADSAIEDYKAFTIENPARIVFDLFNIQSNYEREHLVSVNSEWAKSIRHFGYPDRVRLVVDTKAEYLSEYTAKSVENGFVIVVGSDASPPKTDMAEKNDAAKSPAKTAWVNRIDFSSGDAGKSSIIVGTTKSVKYELKKAEENRLQLSLFDTRLPAYRQRPLITTRFESAVDRIIPLQTEAMKNRTEISIELREQVPYYVEQVEDLLLIHFEASTVPPKSLDESELPEWKKIAAETVKVTAEEAAGFETEAMMEKMPEAVSEEGSMEERDAMEPDKKYTGEKIALDFFETDIKNVFRILREISGENFAIDKGVKGTVSLTFEKPVPWDQVLDLVLKMNQLGKVYEGNIIRIATLQALKAEDDARSQALEAEQKSLEQQKALEPLATEYIAISYSNADSEVKPHIEKILSKERGSITVDSRTNQIIVTDTADVIAQAREIVKRIDKVTPQVVIEARIVEATSSFSREMGVVWGVGSGEQSSELLDVDGLTSDVTSTLDSTVGTGDGTYGTNMAVNLPTASTAATLGFNFIDLGGTPLLLNAQLQAMESQGKLEIISAPKIVTLDNKTATIKQGVQYPYNKLDADGNTTTEFIDIVLELNATPHVTPDNRISMKVSIKKSDLGSVINSQQSFTTKEAETELLVDDGDTVVIGGIIKSTVSGSETGIPYLSDIPLLGWLFKSRAKSDDKEELLIFITPRIVQLQQRGT